jgi:hypothetical protein
MLHVTPSQEQQSVPSFHSTLLGGLHENLYGEEGIMGKEFLNWSKARLWSPGHNFTGEEKLEEE